jgi:tripartite-type tricarboxylate transporter receptor subunit TctC
VKLRRRRFLHLAAGTAVALPAISRIAIAQSYPIRPVRWILGAPSGGALDIVARLMGQWLSERLAQPFVIENRPGAGGNIATEVVAHAPPDGHTLLMVGTGQAVNATLYDRLNFNFIRDIAPVSQISREPNVMVVNPAVPAKSVAEFIAYAKAHPGKLNMASSGNGTSAHMAGELFKIMTGVDVVDVVDVPYRGGPPALTDLIGGQVQVMFHHILVDRVHQGRQSAGAGGNDDDPFTSVAGRARGERFRARLRSEHMVRRRRALRTRPRRSSKSSTRKSTRASPTPRSRRGSPTWGAWRPRVRRPTSAN